MSACSCPNCRGQSRKGCWYKKARWQGIGGSREIVLNRDRWSCYVTACPEKGDRADHIEPVHPRMSEAEFYSPANLRASCQRHNTARGVAARLERETAQGMAPAPTRSPFGGPSPFTRRPYRG